MTTTPPEELIADYLASVRTPGARPDDIDRTDGRVIPKVLAEAGYALVPLPAGDGPFVIDATGAVLGQVAPDPPPGLEERIMDGPVRTFDPAVKDSERAEPDVLRVIDHTGAVLGTLERANHPDIGSGGTPEWRDALLFRLRPSLTEEP